MREYARLRGVNLSAVQNAIKSGRIHTEPDGKIDCRRSQPGLVHQYRPVKTAQTRPDI